MKPTKEEIITALKIVIGSYEYAAETGKARYKYIEVKTGMRRCPLCIVFENTPCAFCPASDDDRESSCMYNDNFIWGADENIDKEKAIRRAIELTETLKKLEK